MNSIFSANEPALGYLYQVRYGLLLIISEQNQDAKLLIEKIDDISIEASESLDIYQTKLHINSKANLDIPVKQTPTFRFKVTPHFALPFFA